MGIYLYAVKKSHPIPVQFGKKRIKIHQLQFLSRGADEADIHRIRKMQLGRIRSGWGDELPQYIAVTDKSDRDKGQDHITAVYENPGTIIWYDCDVIPGTHIGWLFRSKVKTMFLTVDELNKLVKQLTPYSDWKKLVEPEYAYIAVTHQLSDVLITLYKSHRLGGQVVDPDNDKTLYGWVG